jgi:hypothetical protein
MSEQSINHLGSVMKQLLDTLKTFQKQIMESLNVLKELPQMLSDIRKDLNEGTLRQIEAQGEMEMYSKQARIAAEKEHLLGENVAIDDMEKQLNEDITVVTLRYDKINAELDKECRKRIRELDSTLLDLPEAFPKELLEGLNTSFGPHIQKLFDDASSSYAERMTQLSGDANSAKNEVDNFVKTRNDFFRQINHFQQNQVIDKNRDYCIPVILIKKSDNNNKTLHAFLPGALKYDSNMVISKYNCDDALQEIWEELNIKDKLNGLFKRITWVAKPSTRESLLSKISDFIQENSPKMPLKSEKLIDGFSKIMEKSTIYTVKE